MMYWKATVKNYRFYGITPEILRKLVEGLR